MIHSSLYKNDNHYRKPYLLTFLTLGDHHMHHLRRKELGKTPVFNQSFPRDNPDPQAKDPTSRDIVLLVDSNMPK
jgi:hypothetical protein